MILKVNTDNLTITSEDPMDAEYLESFFKDSIQVKKESDFTRHGFHETDKRSVCVTLTKQENERDTDDRIQRK